jgi:hypothetical protein
MSLVTDRVKRNAEKCRQCVLQRLKLRDILHNKKSTAGKGVFDKDTALALNKGAKFILDSTVKLACNLCPYKEDFEKVYGMTPVEYLNQDNLNINIDEKS